VRLTHKKANAHNHSIQSPFPAKQCSTIVSDQIASLLLLLALLLASNQTPEATVRNMSRGTSGSIGRWCRHAVRPRQ
jgi:hypothetical protein